MTQKKLELIIKESAELKNSPGNFGEVANEKEKVLYFPSQTYKAFEEALGGMINISSTHLLVSCTVSYPTCFKEVQKKLGWTEEEFKRAEEKLMQTLRQYTPEEFFNPIPAPPRAYGASPKDPSDIGRTAQQLINKKKN
ncbi:MAG: hypothetical protein AABY40_03720 [Nanoarchaeota archaeon]